MITGEGAGIPLLDPTLDTTAAALAFLTKLPSLTVISWILREVSFSSDLRMTSLIELVLDCFCDGCLSFWKEIRREFRRPAVLNGARPFGLIAFVMSRLEGASISICCGVSSNCKWCGSTSIDRAMLRFEAISTACDALSWSRWWRYYT